MNFVLIQWIIITPDLASGSSSVSFFYMSPSFFEHFFISWHKVMFQINLVLSPRSLPRMVFRKCVATLQGQAGPWYSHRRNDIHRALGMSGMPLFMGGRATHAASCVSLCMSHVVVPIGEPVLLGVSLIISPSREPLPV